MQGNILLSIGTPVGLIAAADLFVVGSQVFPPGLQPSAGHTILQSVLSASGSLVLWHCTQLEFQVLSSLCAPCMVCASRLHITYTCTILDLCFCGHIMAACLTSMCLTTEPWLCR